MSIVCVVLLPDVRLRQLTLQIGCFTHGHRDRNESPVKYQNGVLSGWFGSRNNVRPVRCASFSATAAGEDDVWWVSFCTVPLLFPLHLQTDIGVIVVFLPTNKQHAVVAAGELLSSYVDGQLIMCVKWPNGNIMTSMRALCCQALRFSGQQLPTRLFLLLLGQKKTIMYDVCGEFYEKLLLAG